MQILNKISAGKIESTAREIHRLIQKEEKLTKRSMTYLCRMVKNSCFYIMFDNQDNIVGFIAREKIFGPFHELKCLLVLPEHRNQGLSDKLLAKSMENKNLIYLASTFEEIIVVKLHALGFKTIKISSLPWQTRLRYLLTRNFSSVRRFFKKRSYLLLKS